MEDLRILNIANNLLTGILPESLFSEGLSELHLNGNFLTGSIPLQIGNSTMLEALRVQDNELTGTLPAEFENLQSLQVLNLGRNQFTGPIPTSLGWSMPNLALINLHESGFVGAIPNSFCDMPSAGQFDTSNVDLIFSPRTSELKVVVVSCNTTEFCNCCEFRGGGPFLQGTIQVECAEFLQDSTF